MQGVKSLLFKSFWSVFNLPMGASGGAMLPLSSTQRCLKKNSKSSLVKKHTLHWLRLIWSRRHFHSAITAGETGTEHLAKWNAQWNRKFLEFPNFREKRQPREVDQNFRNKFCENLRSIWFCTGISGIFGWMESAPNIRYNFFKGYQSRFNWIIVR